MRELLRAGADPKLQVVDSTTPLEAACSAGHVEIVQELLDRAGSGAGGGRSGGGGDGAELLMTASSRGHADVVRLLLEDGVPADAAVEGRPETALWLASSGGHAEVVRELLARGAAVEAADEHGATALWMASFNGHCDAVRELLDYGASPERRTTAASRLWRSSRVCRVPAGTSARGAARLGNRTEVSAMLAGWGEVHSVAARGDVGGVVHLLGGGASVDVLDGRQRTPLWHASRLGRALVACELLQGGAAVEGVHAAPGSPLWIASRMGHLGVVGELLRRGASVNAADERGRTPLWIASNEGHVDVVRALLEAGAALEAASNEGETPLWAASVAGRCVVVRELLDRGARVEARTRNGQSTPLLAACRAGHVEVALEIVRRAGVIAAASDGGRDPVWVGWAERGWVQELLPPRTLAGAATLGSVTDGTEQRSAAVRTARATKKKATSIARRLASPACAAAAA